MAYLTVSMTMIAVGFILFTWGIDRTDELARNAGAMIIGLAIIMWVGGLRIATREQKKQEKRWEQIITILKAMATKMGVDVDNINDGDKR